MADLLSAVPNSIVSSANYASAGRDLIIQNSIFNNASTDINNLNGLVKQFANNESLKRELKLYISSEGVYRDSYSDVIHFNTNETDNRLFLKENDLGIVVDFLKNKKKTLLLLLGEGGTGKTMFCRKLALDLVSQLSSDYVEKNTVLPRDKFIPIYINLPSMRGAVSELIENKLREFGISSPNSIYQLQNEQCFLFILDGYDELSQGSLQNLHNLNKLYLWKLSKVIISCRISHLLDKKDYWKHFVPFDEFGNYQSNLYAEILLSPFNPKNIESYINKWVENYKTLPDDEKNNNYTGDWLNPEKCHKSIQEIPGIPDLIKNPFFLWVTMTVLPTIYDEAKNQKKIKPLMYNKNALLSRFCDYWFKREEDKLVIGNMYPNTNLSMVGENQDGPYWTYAKKLAQKMTREAKITVVEWPITNLSADEEKKANQEWAWFFSTSSLQGEESNERELINLQRKGCPLIKPGLHSYSFIHNEIQTFLDARSFTHSARAIKDQLPTALLNAMFAKEDKDEATADQATSSSPKFNNSI